MHKSIVKFTHVVALTVSGLFLLSGCGGSQKLIAVKSYNKIAISEISSENTIEWASGDETSESTGGQIQSTVKFVGALTKGKNLSEAINEAKHSAKNAINMSAPGIYNKIVEYGLIKLEPEDFIKSNPKFQTLSEDKMKSGSYVAADGYKLLSSDDDERGKLCKEVGADALLFVRVTFEKEKFAGVAGSGALKASVRVYMSLVDQNGESIWSTGSTSLSDNTIGVINGVYNYDDMDKLCSETAVEATDECMIQLKKEMEKLKK